MKNGGLAHVEAAKIYQKQGKEKKDSARKIERVPKPIFVVTKYNSAERVNKKPENLQSTYGHGVS